MFNLIIVNKLYKCILIIIMLKYKNKNLLIFVLLKKNFFFKGVTLLAFGNGAPDIFSALTAITTGGPRSTDEGLGLSFLLGKK